MLRSPSLFLTSTSVLRFEALRQSAAIPLAAGNAELHGESKVLDESTSSHVLLVDLHYGIR